MTKPSVKRIAEITGLSTATVSNALGKKRGVSQSSVEKVFEACKKLGYTVQQKIKGIKLIIYKREGQVVGDTPFFQELIAGVNDECKALGYENHILYLERFKKDFDFQLNSALNDSSNAILLLATEMHTEDLKPFKKALSPVLLLDGWFDGSGFSAFTINNTDSVFEATEYLIKKGHKKIGYLRGKIRIHNFFYRESGWRRSMGLHRYPIDEKHVLTIGTTPQGAYEDMLDIIKKRKKSSKKDNLPTAFISDNDIIAMGALKALKQSGYKIPDDISIIGFDDMPYADMVDPPLTTILVRKREMGKAAVRQLNNMIKSPQDIILKSEICNEFVERGSVKNI
ncbi:MAG: LacI family DNA-binding transcriptional regulator [Spirochaetaceae bacterium]|jgi:LacI family transcriptional regulator|nr:LacI family DNA-binding transcriptional regulator [Spirochaetaceae bacterium]